MDVASKCGKRWLREVTGGICVEVLVSREAIGPGGFRSTGSTWSGNECEGFSLGCCNGLGNGDMTVLCWLQRFEERLVCGRGAGGAGSECHSGRLETGYGSEGGEWVIG